jgi:hypothetical protein
MFKTQAALYSLSICDQRSARLGSLVACPCWRCHSTIPISITLLHTHAILSILTTELLIHLSIFTDLNDCEGQAEVMQQYSHQQSHQQS